MQAVDNENRIPEVVALETHFRKTQPDMKAFLSAWHTYEDYKAGRYIPSEVREIINKVQIVDHAQRILNRSSQQTEEYFQNEKIQGLCTEITVHSSEAHREHLNKTTSSKVDKKGLCTAIYVNGEEVI